MGVATCKRGGAGLRGGMVGGGWVSGFTGRALGDAGIARPKRGARDPLLLRLPGMGGRNSGAGDGDAMTSIEELVSIKCL